jgi:hypothetical protein
MFCDSSWLQSLKSWGLRQIRGGSVFRLSSLNLADIEPAGLRVAARLPSTLEPRGVKVRLELTGGARGQVTREFVLEPAVEPGEATPLTGYNRRDARLWIYRLTGDDVKRLQRLQSEAAGGAGGAGISISAGVEACHRKELLSTLLPTTTFLRANAAGYFILAEDLDLRSVVSERDLVKKVPPCS